MKYIKTFANLIKSFNDLNINIEIISDDKFKNYEKIPFSEREADIVTKETNNQVTSSITYDRNNYIASDRKDIDLFIISMDCYMENISFKFYKQKDDYYLMELNSYPFQKGYENVHYKLRIDSTITDLVALSNYIITSSNKIKNINTTFRGKCELYKILVNDIVGKATNLQTKWLNTNLNIKK